MSQNTVNYKFYTTEKGNYSLRFDKLPVALDNDFYRNKLSVYAKLAYAKMYSRMSLSVKYGWIDEEGRPYFIYPNKELANTLNCSERKVCKVKKELEEVQLLFQVKQGFNPKKGKNDPNRLYLCEPEVEADDIYANKQGSAQNDKSDYIDSKIQKAPTTGKNVKESDTNSTKSIATSGSAQETLELDNINSKTDINTDTSTDSKSSEHKSIVNQSLSDKDLLDNIVEILNHNLDHHTILTDSALNMLGKSCETITELQNRLQAIYSAKRYAENKIKLDYPIFEDDIFPDGYGQTISEKISRDVLSALLRLKTGKIRGDFSCYIWGTVKTTFMEFRNHEKRQEDYQNNPNHIKIPLNVY